MDFDEYADKYYVDRIKLADEIVKKYLGTTQLHNENSSFILAVFDKVASPLVYLRREYDEQNQAKQKPVDWVNTVDLVKKRLNIPVGSDGKFLVNYFDIKDRDNTIYVNPKQFLENGLFRKSAEVIKKLGGEYVSAGKDSHFRIPKEPKK